MTFDEFHTHIGKAGLTLAEFARLMQMHPVSISNKKTRGVRHHLAVVAALFGEMPDRDINFRQIVSKIDTAVTTPGSQKRE